MGEAVPFIPDDEMEDAQARSRVRRGRTEARLPHSPAPQLPHSIEAEETVLGCCGVDGGVAVARAFAAGVRVGSFYDPKHGTVWAAFEKLWSEKKPCDIACVAEELRAAGKLEGLGGWAFLSQVSERVATTAQFEYFLERVLGLAERRALIVEASRLQERAYDLADGGAGGLSAGVMDVLDRLQEMRVRSQRELPAVQSDAELEAEVLPEPPMLIDKVAHVGGVCLFLGPSKASKTFTCMDISVAVASGTPWIGQRTHQGGVLHIDFELPKWDLRKRAAKLKELRRVSGALRVDWWSLRGRCKPIEQLAPLIIARAPRGKFALIVLEPAYKILGKRDENDNADVTDFMNWLFYIQESTGAAVLCTHHFAKGDAGKKEAKDRGSGAGAWVRAPDTAITCTPLDESQGEDCYSMEFIERSMKRHAAIGVQFEYPVFKTVEGLDLTALREAGRPRESSTGNIVAVLEEKGARGVESGLTFSKVMDLAERKGMSRSTAKRRLEEAVEVKRVRHVGNVYFLSEEI